MKIVFALFSIHIISYWTTVLLYTLIYNQWNKESKKVVYNVLINQLYYTSSIIYRLHIIHNHLNQIYTAYGKYLL